MLLRPTSRYGRHIIILHTCKAGNESLQPRVDRTKTVRLAEAMRPSVYGTLGRKCALHCLFISLPSAPFVYAEDETRTITTVVRLPLIISAVVPAKNSIDLLFEMTEEQAPSHTLCRVKDQGRPVRCASPNKGKGSDRQVACVLSSNSPGVPSTASRTLSSPLVLSIHSNAVADHTMLTPLKL